MDIGVLIKLVGGAMVLVAGLVQVLKVPRLRRNRVRTVGRVTGVKPFDTDEGRLYAPVVAFADEHGGAHKFTAEWGTGGGQHDLGDEVPVTYPADRPEDARLSSTMQNALTFVLPLGLGGVFILVGLILLGSLALG
ncbi:DUF3592 domain-containing protein [Actinoplanes sp. NPDC049265]|uniref:DUF3592 domain-containing protein n=1 Tax=Actinoplanes sp. NPDC049265 TaxID=3363902 RepID=UPI0037121AC2